MIYNLGLCGFDVGLVERWTFMQIVNMNDAQIAKTDHEHRYDAWAKLQSK